jgi:glutamate-1-semialdehyde 2,1-aminomutase
MPKTLTPPPLLGLHPAAITDESAGWFERAKKVLAGGISSSARSTTTGDLPYPLYLTRGRGSRVWDADGNQYVDYLIAYGSLMLGHTDPGLTDALTRQVELGTMFGTCNTVEVQLAELICKLVPCADLVRFANCGSEAMQGAIRAARGFTGRTKILKFEGHYHGWVDVVAISNRPDPADAGPFETPLSHAHSKGMPQSVVDDVVICPWNEPEILRTILNAHPGQFAAVIAEPIVANNACIMPDPGYLNILRDQCTSHGAMLIFDEVVTGFRIAPGGAQTYFDVVPDLAVFSKAIGGGLPLSAFAGRRHVMEPIARNTVKHGGTYNASPLCAAASLHVLTAIAHGDVLDRAREHGEAVIEAIRRTAHDCRVPLAVQGVGSVFQVVFTPDGKAPRNYRELAKADFNRFAAFRQVLLENGVHTNSTAVACWFVSGVHGADDLPITIDAVDRALAAVR